MRNRMWGLSPRETRAHASSDARTHVYTLLIIAVTRPCACLARVRTDVRVSVCAHKYKILFHVLPAGRRRAADRTESVRGAVQPDAAASLQAAILMRRPPPPQWTEPAADAIVPVRHRGHATAHETPSVLRNVDNKRHKLHRICIRVVR